MNLINEAASIDEDLSVLLIMYGMAENLAKVLIRLWHSLSFKVLFQPPAAAVQISICSGVRVSLQ